MFLVAVFPPRYFFYTRLTPPISPPPYHHHPPAPCDETRWRRPGRASPRCGRLGGERQAGGAVAQLQTLRGEGAPAPPAEGMGGAWGEEEARSEHPPFRSGERMRSWRFPPSPPVCSRAESVLNCCIYDSSQARVGRGVVLLSALPSRFFLSVRGIFGGGGAACLGRGVPGTRRGSFSLQHADKSWELEGKRHVSSASSHREVLLPQRFSGAWSVTWGLFFSRSGEGNLTPETKSSGWLLLKKGKAALGLMWDT